MSRDSPLPQKEEDDDDYDAPRPMSWTIKFDSLSGLHQPPIDGPLWCEPSYDAQSIPTLEASDALGAWHDSQGMPSLSCIGLTSFSPPQ